MFVSVLRNVTSVLEKCHSFPHFDGKKCEGTKEEIQEKTKEMIFLCLFIVVFLSLFFVSLSYPHTHTHHKG